MDYDISIPDIYNIKSNNDSDKNKDKNIIIKSFTLKPNKFYDIFTNTNYNDEYDEYDEYNDFDEFEDNVYIIYFKTKTHKIELYINNSKFEIHNNLLLLMNIHNRKTSNSYCLYNSDFIEHSVDVYLIIKKKYNLNIYNTSYYFKNNNNYCRCDDICECGYNYKRNLFYIEDNRYKSFYSHYCSQYNSHILLLNFYVKTKNHNISNIIKLNNNNIIFYFKHNYKVKYNNTDYLYKYNLIKLENIITDKKIIFKDNNMIISNIDNVYTYLDKIENIYLNVCDFLFYDKKTNSYNDIQYLLDFKKFMIHNDIDEIYYNLITYYT
jgi:hypothetical protein